VTAEQAEQLINTEYTFIGVLPTGKVVVQRINRSKMK